MSESESESETDTAAEVLIKTFKRPCCKMISAALMGALVGERIEQAEANRRMKAMLPSFGKYANELGEPLNHMFTVNVFVWAMSDEARGGFFAGDDLTLHGLAGLVSEGANDWRRICRDKELPLRTIRPLFFAIKELLDELFKHNVKKKSWPHQFMCLMDDFAESFDWS